MKLYILTFLIFCVSGILFLSKPFETKNDISIAVNPEFVSIKNNQFFLKTKPFYPIALNYVVSMQGDEKGNVWASSCNSYNSNNKFLYTTKDSSHMQLKAEMDLMKEKGFNTIRIVRIGEELVSEDGSLSFKASINNQRDTVYSLSDAKNYLKYFGAIEELLKLSDNAGLKVILLVSTLPDVKRTEDHLVKFAIRFKNTSALMAYDLFNEPLYFDKKERKKEEVFEIAKNWNQLIKTNAPNQLFTIGLEGIREVFEWDPNILDVDFVSLHPYEYEPEQVANELYWYGKYITKPWMLGETAISADNDSVSYESQALFAAKTLKRTRDCGAIGYSWWQFKDVDWHLFHANYMGIVNWVGETKTQKQNIVLKGTVKPVAEVFKNYNPAVKKDSCNCLTNYYNYTNNNKFRLVGYMYDMDEQPIEGGVVLAWNQWWSHSYHTITKKDGSFELYSSYPFYHWMASSTLHSMVRGDFIPDSAKFIGNIPTINIGKLKLKSLNL